MSDKAIDKKIDELFAVVKAQKVEVEKAEKESKRSWNTNCSFKLYGATPVNLQTATEDMIFKSLTELLTFKGNAEEAIEILGLKKEIKHDGYSVGEWIEDFQKRIATIQLKMKKEKLKTLEDRLTSIVSPEQKREMELAAIMKEMSE